MKKAIFLLSAISGLVLLTYCKDPEPTPPSPPLQTSEQLLSGYNKDSKIWIQTKIVEDSVDVTFNNQPCYMDNEFVFMKNSQFYFREGPAKCVITDPDTFENGNWYFNTPKTKVSLVESGDTTDTWDIITLTETQLRVKYYDKTYSLNRDITFKAK